MSQNVIKVRIKDGKKNKIEYPVTKLCAFHVPTVLPSEGVQWLLLHSVCVSGLVSIVG